MAERQSIVVNGDLGSGKTTVTLKLSERLDIRRISVGDLYREMARRRGMTTLQLNRHAELDDAVDAYVDSLQGEIAQSGEQLVVDSRLAWFFFTDALKVHLITDPTVAAERVLGRPSSEVESYATLVEARQRLRERSESERARFLVTYGADKCRLRNYNLVCDSTRATPDEIVDQIAAAFHGTLAPQTVRSAPPLLLIDPRRIYPTQESQALRDEDPEFVAAIGRAGPGALAPLRLGFADNQFFAVDGHRRLSAALRNDFSFVPASLAAEGDEPVVGGLSAKAYLESEVGPSIVYDWAELHGLELPLPEHLRQESPVGD
ncbi:AAA family ATPase [Natronosporangium hydrolyticum]|uniref:AAA family ATPase n=1 Tax=Natronosporangium hydrolyticum TaxID=2811111 RepID=A0A895YNW4_9ACTN|nr:AAA family ATPase [Natronosporangium hydrolyticum]QSB16973.1 AAA family ATPase [Natronosporangium hydrolyticum]